MHNLNARQQNEPLEAYHQRLRERAKAEKLFLAGRLVWDSKRQGTYVKAKHS